MKNKILLGVTGCIGAYKAILILREFQERGYSDVQVILTPHAEKFVAPLTFEAISGQAVITHQFAAGMGKGMTHIALADQAELLVVAPATANIIGKFAHGVADDFLSTLYLSMQRPVLIAPAMNVKMYRHPAVQNNIQTLRDRRVHVIDPEEGYLACGYEGEGRLADPHKIVEAALVLLAEDKPLEGKHVLVTAGPTREHLDPVRFLSNRSSGKMGYAIARIALQFGATVDLVTGPTELPAPYGVRVTRVGSAADMRDQVLSLADASDIVIMAAAVTNFRPREQYDQKIKRGRTLAALDLVENDDILLELAKTAKGNLLVGFAAETEDLATRAIEKRHRKQLDLIVANDVSGEATGFVSDENEVLLIDRNDKVEKISRRGKDEIAACILRRVAAMLGERRPDVVSRHGEDIVV